MKKHLLLVAFIALSCSKDNADPLVISDVEINIKYDGKHQYSIKKGNKELSNSSVDWKVNDKNIGTISSDGLFKARKVGVTHINASTNYGLVQANINVIPYSKIFAEPITKFGSSMSDIKYLEKRKFLAQVNNNTLAFEGENSKVKYVLYLFEKDKLEAVGVNLAFTTDIAKETNLFLSERFPQFGAKDGIIYFFNDEKTMGIAYYADSQGLNALYAPYNATKRSNGSKDINKAYTEALGKAIKSVR